jgi:predicted naringenin-chalcone synthase
MVFCCAASIASRADCCPVTTCSTALDGFADHGKFLDPAIGHVVAALRGKLEHIKVQRSEILAVASIAVNLMVEPLPSLLAMLVLPAEVRR